MKIAFDHQIFAWQQYGGISRYMTELAGRLASACKQEVSILAPFYINNYIKYLPSEVTLLGIRAPVFKYCGRIYRPINYWMVRLAIRQFKPDIIHETYFSSVDVARGKAKVVLTVYDMIDEIFADVYSSISPVRKEKATAVKRADHIICISETTRRDLVRILNVPIEKTSVVHLGFSLTTIPQETLRDLYKPKNFILYVGSRKGYKNFYGLLHAYATSEFLKNKYDLICFGGGAFTAKEIELYKGLGLSSNQVQQVSGDDAVLAIHYKSAKLFVYPSLYEGFGIPPLEAMSFDCPVVCSDTGSLPEVVGNAALMFDPTNYNSIQVTIEKVIENESLKNDLIERGRKQVALFSWEKCAQETLEVYKKVCS